MNSDNPVRELRLLDMVATSALRLLRMRHRSPLSVAKDALEREDYQIAADVLTKNTDSTILVDFTGLQGGKGLQKAPRLCEVPTRDHFALVIGSKDVRAMLEWQTDVLDELAWVDYAETAGGTLPVMHNPERLSADARQHLESVIATCSTTRRLRSYWTQSWLLHRLTSDDCISKVPHVGSGGLSFTSTVGIGPLIRKPAVAYRIAYELLYAVTDGFRIDPCDKSFALFCAGKQEALAIATLASALAGAELSVLPSNGIQRHNADAAGVLVPGASYCIIEDVVWGAQQYDTAAEAIRLGDGRIQYAASVVDMGVGMSSLLSDVQIEALCRPRIDLEISFSVRES